jgi:hypothetical protein
MPTIADLLARARSLQGGAVSSAEATTTDATPVVALRWPEPLPKDSPTWPPEQPCPTSKCEPFPQGMASLVRVQAVAMSTSGECAGYERLAVVMRPVGGSLTLVGAVTIAELETDSVWGLLVGVVGELLVVSVRGDATDRTHWIVRIELLNGAQPTG